MRPGLPDVAGLPKVPKPPTLPRLIEHARDELAWLRFVVPRQGVQLLARVLPLSRLRDALPPAIAARLRRRLYPARVEPAGGKAACERRHPAWGDPAELDATRPVRYEQPVRASVLVVAHGNPALTRLCLASLQRAAGATPFEVILVDNASPDGSAAELRALAASGLLPLRFVENETNRGFAAASNQAARLARGDVLVFLNNDTVVPAGWLDRLVAHLDADPGLGLIGATTNACGNPEQEVAAPYADVPSMERLAAERAWAHAGEAAAISMAVLFCAALPRPLFDEVGGLDEGYRVGMFEDDDLAEAVRRRGRRVAVARDVFVHHWGGASFARLPQVRYLRIFWENRRRYEKKWGARWQER